MNLIPSPAIPNEYSIEALHNFIGIAPRRIYQRANSHCSKQVRQPMGVQLSHEQLPQRIEILFAGKWPVDSYDAETPPSLSLPQVLGVPVERTLVTLTSDGHESRWGLQGTSVARCAA
jgi:hypothetical protein